MLYTGPASTTGGTLDTHLNSKLQVSSCVDPPCLGKDSNPAEEGETWAAKVRSDHPLQPHHPVLIAACSYLTQKFKELYSPAPVMNLEADGFVRSSTGALWRW